MFKFLQSAYLFFELLFQVHCIKKIKKFWPICKPAGHTCHPLASVQLQGRKSTTRTSIGRANNSDRACACYLTPSWKVSLSLHRSRPIVQHFHLGASAGVRHDEQGAHRRKHSATECSTRPTSPIMAGRPLLRRCRPIATYQGMFTCKSTSRRLKWSSRCLPWPTGLAPARRYKIRRL
jgi:hypothetical protein